MIVRFDAKKAVLNALHAPEATNLSFSKNAYSQSATSFRENGHGAKEALSLNYLNIDLKGNYA